MPKSNPILKSFNAITVPFVIFVTTLFLMPSAATAQDTVTGAFEGKVFSSINGTYIGGAAVVITSESTGVAHTLTADSNGRFYQGLLAPGWYQIRVTFAGFKSRLLRREIKVSATGEVVPVPVALDPEPPGAPPSVPTLEPADDIRVEINTADARRDASFKTEELERLPLGGTTATRSFDELALLAPGVAPPPQTIGDVAGPGVGPGVGSAGQFAVNGLRSRANNFTVDGSDNNDEDIGVRRQGFVALTPQPIESVQEFQIITLLAPAQFGRNIGGQVNAVSKAGGKETHGSVYGFFNSNRLSARNFFDTTNGSETSQLRTAAGQPVMLDGNPLPVTNQSGGEDPFTFLQGGATFGGPIVKERTFYFLSGEYEKINASQEESFTVPTVEERGPFGTGATGIFRDPFLPLSDPNSRISAVPNEQIGAGLNSLFPFPNNTAGIYGANTFTQVLPASGRGAILSGRLDHNFPFFGRPQSLTARYNFTDDKKDIPSVGEAIFASVRSKIRTHNLSVFLNSRLNEPASDKPLLNQFRFSVGRTHLRFNEIRDTQFLVPSSSFPNDPFYLNAPVRLNLTMPFAAGVANAGPVTFRSSFRQLGSPALTTAEELFGGPLGEVQVAGFSTLGTDVYNFPQDRTNTTLQFADEVTWRARNHSAVFGADIRRSDLDSDLPRLSRPLVTFNGVPRLVQPQAGVSCANGTLSGFCLPSANDPNPIVRPIDLLGLGAATNFLLSLNVDRPDSRAKLRFYQFNFYAQDTWRVKPNLSLAYGLRYEYNSPVNEVNGLIENTFTDPRLALVPGLTRLIKGRTNLYEPDKNNFAPRIGVAYTAMPFGNQRVSVLRAGYGLFYDQILGAVANQSRNVFPSFVTFNFAALNFTGSTALQFINPLATTYNTNSGVMVPLLQPGSTNVLNPNLPFSEFIGFANANFPNAITSTLPAQDLEMPMAHHYDVTFEQQLNRNFTASVAYVGTSGRKLLRFTTPNLGPSLIATPTQSFPITYTLDDRSNLPVILALGVLRSPNRPDRSVGSVNIFATNASSNYNSLQTELRGRFVNRFELRMSYTLSKTTDEVSDVFDLAGAYALPQDSSDLKAERGPANFDVRHRLAYEFIYQFPKLESNSFLNVLTDQLQIATTGKYHSGQPFTVNSIIDVNLDGNLTDRLNTTDGIAATGDRSQPIRLTTNNPFSLLAPFGHNGQVKRNSFRAGSVLELDLSIIKQFSLGRAQHLSLRTDIFNFINRANFGVPVRLLESTGFGKATSTVTPARRVQLAIKYEF
jgi:hypothetical protein